MSTDKMVKLKSSNGETFEVEDLVAHKLKKLKTLIKATAGTDIPISLKVSGNILSTLLEFCRYHVESQKSSNMELPVPEHIIMQWATVQANPAMLADLSSAAFHLGAGNLIVDTIVNGLKHKSPEEIRKFLNIKDI